MKQIIFSLIVMFAGSVAAQAPKEPAKEPAKAAEPMKEAAKPLPVKDGAKKAQPRRWNEDARHCLERGNNTDIIKCAEEYL